MFRILLDEMLFLECLDLVHDHVHLVVEFAQLVNALFYLVDGMV